VQHCGQKEAWEPGGQEGDAPAVHLIDPPAQHESQQQPRVGAEGRIGKLEVLLDRLEQDGKNLSIHEVQGEDRQEEPQGIPPVPCRYSVLAVHV
jgi:hypothetical protein